MANLKPGCIKPLRICIGMINSPNIPKYSYYSTILNYEYATKHSYDFVVNRCPDDTDIDWKWDPKNEYVTVWYKPEFIKKYLPYYHIFVFIDSDAYFKDIEKSVEKFIEEEDVNNKDTLIYVSADFKNNHIKWTNGPNTGIIIAKNTPRTFEILDEWIKAPNTSLCESYKRVHTREQACLWKLKDNKYNKEIKIVQPPVRLGTHEGEWIVHLAATNNNIREEYFKNILKKHFDTDFNSHADNCASQNENNKIYITILIVIIFILIINYIKV